MTILTSTLLVATGRNFFIFINYSTTYPMPTEPPPPPPPPQGPPRKPYDSLFSGPSSQATSPHRPPPKATLSGQYNRILTPLPSAYAPSPAPSTTAAPSQAQSSVFRRILHRIVYAPPSHLPPSKLARATKVIPYLLFAFIANIRYLHHCIQSQPLFIGDSDDDRGIRVDDEEVLLWSFPTSRWAFKMELARGYVHPMRVWWLFKGVPQMRLPL